MEAKTVADPIETKLGADFSWKALVTLPSSSPSKARPRVPSWKERNKMLLGVFSSPVCEILERSLLGFFFGENA